MITFVGMRSRSSGQVRGVQIAPEVGGNFFDADTNSFLGTPGFHKTVIFVRRFLPDLASKLKNQGCIIGYDVIDMPVANLHREQSRSPDTTEIDWKTVTNNLIDFYIVNNRKSKERLTPVVSDESRVFVIPHHCANKKVTFKKKQAMQTVGYIGLPDQLHCKDEIKSYVNSLGLSFFEGHPRDLRECQEMIDKIDIGVIFLERNNRTGYVLDYKPNQKLSNFQCAGIPTVCSEYESFKEFGGNAYLAANSLNDLKTALGLVCKDKDFRDELVKRGHQAAEPVLLKNIANDYRKLLRAI